MSLELLLAPYKSQLVKGDTYQINTIEESFTLPKIYKDFLENYSPTDTMCFKAKRLPINICFQSPNNVNNLIDLSGLLVVATEDLISDFFIMDVLKTDGEDAPIYYIPHDDDLAPRLLIASSFKEFLTMSINGEGIFEKIYQDDFEELVSEMK